MKFKIGADFHDINEVSLSSMTIREIPSPRGVRMFTLYQLYLRGELQGTELELDAKITQLINRYRDNYLDVGLYHDDGTPTPHVILNSDPQNVSGNHVRYRSWPKDTDGEYATGRTFAIMVEAKFDEGDSGLLNYSETVTYDGDCGPIYDAHVTRTGPPKLHLVAQQTAQRIVQSGFALTMDAYYLPPSPLFSGNPMFRRPIYELGTPQFQGQQHIGYKTRWSYYMLSGVDVSATPPTLV